MKYDVTLKRLSDDDYCPSWRNRGISYYVSLKNLRDDGSCYSMRSRDIKYGVTLKQLRDGGACFSGYNRVVRMVQGKKFTQSDKLRIQYLSCESEIKISLEEIARNNGLSDAIWCFRVIPGCERDARMFAIWCARQVEHMIKDKRSLDALDVAERFADGDATEGEVEHAAKCADSALWEINTSATRRYPEWIAYGVAAHSLDFNRSIVEYVTRLSDGSAKALDYESQSAKSAFHVTYDESIEKQTEMFIRMCNGEAPWQK